MTTPQDSPSRSNVGPYVVLAQEGKNGFIVGVYGPFGTVEQASKAAIRHSVDGIKATPLALFTAAMLGTW